MVTNKYFSMEKNYIHFNDNQLFIHGSVKPGFEAVQDEFQRNFTERDELGAACAVYWHGEKVVDLWGGIRDPITYAPWEEDTLVPVFSTTKGMAAMALAHAHSEGLLDFDETVATYWHEFAQNGKEAITVRQLLSHQAGLCGLDETLDYDTMSDPEQLSVILARQKPAWVPGTKQGYHAQTMGLYMGELIRRIDPQKRSIGQYFHDNIAEPLDLEFYISLPDSIPAGRVATLKGYRIFQMLLNMRKMRWSFVSKLLNPKSLTAAAFVTTTIFTDIENYNQRSLQRIEFPSANGIGTARSIAKAYSEFATGGKVLHIQPTTLAELMKVPTPSPEGTFDEVLRAPTAFSLGFSKPSETLPFGTTSTAFGMPGTGGSFGFADPDQHVGYAYVMNRCGFYPANDPREKALRDAVYRCI